MRRHLLTHRRPMRRLAPRRARPPAPAGQSLIEFSLMLIFLTVLLMGVLDLGRAYFTYLALKDAAGEGAYFGSAFPQCVDEDGINNDSGQGCGQPAHTIPARVKDTAPRGGLVDWYDRSAAIKVDLPCEGAAAGSCVLEDGELLTVTVAYSYQMITPFVGAIANGQALTLTARSSAVIVRVPDCTVKPCR